MTVPNDRVAAFRDLHAAGCFVMPNPWDAGSARALEQLGFPALATTSAGIASGERKTFTISSGPFTSRIDATIGMPSIFGRNALRSLSKRS